MTRTLLKLALGISLALLAGPSDALAGRGGGRGGPGGGRGGFGGDSRGGGMGGSPSFSQPRQSMNGARPQGNSGNGNRSAAGNRTPNGNQPEPGTRPQSGSAAGYANRNQTSPSNAGAAAAGAGYANRNQPGASNAGAAAAGAGYSNRNQPGVSNAGAAAAGAGYSNRNQPGVSNAGAAAAGAGYANRNQPAYPNAGAAAAGAGYANRNQYNQYHPGMVNGYWNGNNSAAWGAAGYGLGAGTGVAAWGAGSPMYGYGYSGYNNPYYGVAAGPAGGLSQAGAPAYNYSQPISTTAAPPEPTAAGQATAAFDQAREAFQAGDYAKAQQLDQQALAQMPNDTTLHEFLALALFAQGQYEQAAAPLYAVLSVGPGWDWTTLSGMYPDVATYTGQLRALETYVGANPRSAPAHFVLAYQYLSQGHDENAIAQLQQVVKLQPGDTLSAQLIARSQPAGGTQAPAAEAALAAAPAADGKLPGTWAATPAADSKITLAIQDGGRFSWTSLTPGKPATKIAGASTFANGVLTLVDQVGQNGALSGSVVWQDADHFNFRLTGAPSTDPGLSFGR
ncbi:MAG: hypothetical protein P4L84_13235 [Isosphaeraceae bacterium]|nr:hypothetical protein [Isosphaeraceae bacterium]